MVTPNPANGGHSKSGQLKGLNADLFLCIKADEPLSPVPPLQKDFGH
jgi:hypothetical protein